jgi:hypothetical protein
MNNLMITFGNLVEKHVWEPLPSAKHAKVLDWVHQGAQKMNTSPPGP